LTRFRREHVGFVFQFYNLIPNLTARENVALVTEIAQDPMSAEEALRLVGLGHRLDHFPSQLSGGEQQRVAIARAVAPNPAILVADEPTGNLDESTGGSIIDLLFALKRHRGSTLVLVTHDLALAARCDRMVRLRSGNIDVDALAA
jgi:putative ABC transport system ATP-binding protein